MASGSMEHMEGAQSMSILSPDIVQTAPRAPTAPSVEEAHSLVISHSDPWWKTSLASYSAGVMCVITGHPFDSIKIRVQTGATKDLFRHLWRGMIPPLITTPPSWSLNFLLYQASLNIFATETVSNAAFAGGVSGIIWSTCVTPPELIKCYAQRYHMTTPQAMKDIYSKLGGSMYTYVTKGLYRGYVACLVRDVPGVAGYFGGLEAARKYLPGYNDSTVLMPFLSGAICGVITWTFAMPGDCLKSIIQTEFALAKSGEALPSTSVIVNARRLMAESGSIFRFWRGYRWMIARSIVTSGIGIVGLENVVRFLDDW